MCKSRAKIFDDVEETYKILHDLQEFYCKILMETHFATSRDALSKGQCARKMENAKNVGRLSVKNFLQM